MNMTAESHKSSGGWQLQREDTTERVSPNDGENEARFDFERGGAKVPRTRRSVSLRNESKGVWSA